MPSLISAVANSIDVQARLLHRKPVTLSLRMARSSNARKTFRMSIARAVMRPAASSRSSPKVRTCRGPAGMHVGRIVGGFGLADTACTRARRDRDDARGPAAHERRCRLCRAGAMAASRQQLQCDIRSVDLDRYTRRAIARPGLSQRCSERRTALGLNISNSMVWDCYDGSGIGCVDLD